MSKRFTDTSKWERVWIRKLTPARKCFLFYLLDNCSNAGIWNVDFETAEHFINGKVPHENFFPQAEFPIVELDAGKKWFLVDFIPFQYPNGLQPNNRAHHGIIRELEKYGIDYNDPVGASMALPRAFDGAQDMEQEPEQVKDKVKEQEQGGGASLGPDVHPKIRGLWYVLHRECPTLFRMKEPLSVEQLTRLASRYSLGAMMKVFRAMENKPGITTKYKSANLTAQNWLQRDGPGPDKPLLAPPSVDAAEPQPKTPAEREQMAFDLLVSTYGRFLAGEDVTNMPGAVYNCLIKRGYIKVEGDDILYQQTRACTKTETRRQATELITAANVNKQGLTPGEVLIKFAKPDDLAKSLAVKFCFELFKLMGAPWQV